jgi:hypothetical protein
MNLHPYEMIRPDNIMRSGTIQPFSVRSMDPVQYARAEINPFIQAIRPAGPQLGGLGITRADVVPTLGNDAAAAVEAKTKLVIGVGGFTGGLIVGAIAAWLIFK